MSVLTKIEPHARMLGLLGVTVVLGLLHLLSDPVPSNSGVALHHNDDIVLPTSRDDSSKIRLSVPRDVNVSSNEPRPVLEPARRNPFVLNEPPVQVAKAPTAPAVAQVMVAPPSPPAPTAPPLNLSFAGRVRDLDGKESIYLTWGDKTMSAEVGAVLPNGYRVERIGTDAIDLLFVELNTPARLALPAAPRYEIR